MDMGTLLMLNSSLINFSHNLYRSLFLGLWTWAPAVKKSSNRQDYRTGASVVRMPDRVFKNKECKHEIS